MHFKYSLYIAHDVPSLTNSEKSANSTLQLILKFRFSQWGKWVNVEMAQFVNVLLRFFVKKGQLVFNVLFSQCFHHCGGKFS